MVNIGTPLNQVDTTAQFTIGSQRMVRDTDFDSMNIYEYHPGGSDSATGTVYEVSGWSSTGSVTRATTTTRGQIGVAMGTITSKSYGWYLVKGMGWALCGTTTASGTAIYASGTVGSVGARATINSLIVGMVSAGAGTPSATGTVKVSLTFPSINGAI